MDADPWDFEDPRDSEDLRDVADPRDSVDLQVLDRAEAELEDVERALVRLDEGSYASCEACGRPIGDDRLAASAVTRRCADHAQPVAPMPAGT